MRRTLQKELESRGSIFTGRDEKSILIRKRQEERQKMKEDLERQIAVCLLSFSVSFLTTMYHPFYYDWFTITF